MMEHFYQKKTSIYPGGLFVRGEEVDRRLRAEGAGDRRGREVLRHGTNVIKHEAVLLVMCDPSMNEL